MEHQCLGAPAFTSSMIAVWMPWVWAPSRDMCTCSDRPVYRLGRFIGLLVGHRPMEEVCVALFMPDSLSKLWVVTA